MFGRLTNFVSNKEFDLINCDYQYGVPQRQVVYRDTNKFNLGIALTHKTLCCHIAVYFLKQPVSK